MGDGDPVFEQGVEQAGDRGERKRLGMERLDKARRAFAHRVEDRAHFVGAKQKLGPLAQKLVEVGGDDRAGVDGQEALGNRLSRKAASIHSAGQPKLGSRVSSPTSAWSGRASPASIASTRSARTIAPPKGTPPSRMR
jgi:hypothetical protein